MALPVRPTPRLGKEASRDFCARVDRDLQIKAAPPPTPDIDKVIARIVADANDSKKQG
ncbi:hypothetical protein Deba_0417 [Desulfarculus baarsii DSM 2075]|uniref:Uncharacterized protein n=1 Tax=Desulfarculus baarsii (strain ATCC 33931 / DSM 2075 / LMG 7858 / VKM B-1802 / 2st14) TaxID=644282 RepID=E1QE06_DESB2|nr:hypothetical protein [Desulfarculus baarsii]ADK83792.1 hypothetical protein Deba_0417 [Desulfarculus baarsii DSM 2075]